MLTSNINISFNLSNTLLNKLAQLVCLMNASFCLITKNLFKSVPVSSNSCTTGPVLTSLLGNLVGTGCPTKIVMVLFSDCYW